MAAASEDSKQIFLALGQHFAVQGQLDVFATEILPMSAWCLRPQLIHRVDTSVDLLARVPGACGAGAPGTGRREGCRSEMLVPANICASSSKRHGRPLRRRKG